jgi:hypothetical protein
MNYYKFGKRVRSRDEYKKEYITIKAVLVATTTNLPRRDCLSREKTKGYTGYVDCLDETNAVWLMNNQTMAYMGHHWFPT